MTIADLIDKHPMWFTFWLLISLGAWTNVRIVTRDEK